MALVLPTDVEFQIPTEGRYVHLIRKGIRSLAEGAGFDEVDCQDIEVAVGEAVTNAILHGCPSGREGKVTVRSRLTPRRLIVEVEDQGGGKCLPIPSELPDDDKEHGRGWILICALMDRTSVRFAEDGLLVRMIKRRHRRGPLRKTFGMSLQVA